MPTYDYTCDACGHEFEREQRITADPIKKCPGCGKLKARRMIGGGGFILKGGGWESDLYSGPSNRSKTQSKSESKSEPKSESKSEPKSSESKSSESGSSSTGKSSKGDSKSSTGS